VSRSEPYELDSRLAVLKARVRAGAQSRFRRPGAPDVLSECEAEGLSWPRRAARLVRRMCEAQEPVIEPEERIVFTRTVTGIPPIHSPEDLAALTAGRTVHELGPISNICADWGKALSQGLLGRRDVALETRRRLSGDPEAVEFLDAAIETIDAVLDLARRYAEKAREDGRDDVADVLVRVPAHRPRTFREALQSLRLLHAVLWLGGHYHCGLGRLDQYLWPYLEADFVSGRLDRAGAEDLLAEFFIALNRDSDLYPGVQQGDNGQSLMLGGVRPDGSPGENPLTAMVLRVARGVAMIDPKINLRISPETRRSLIELASELTRMGLGFPQYASDAVVIPGLIAQGYEPEDARDYTVAACWEFIIPGKGMEVVNIGAVSFPAAADRAIREGLDAGDGFEGILARAGADMHRQVDRLAGAYRDLLLPPAPWYSVLMDGPLETGRDLSRGLKYNNFGIHGACSSSAADALAAAKTLVLDEGRIEPARLLRALERDFEGDEDLRRILVDEAPKVGLDDDRADVPLARLFDLFAGACAAAGSNGRGGTFRSGTGSAMYYVWLARGHEGMREPVVGATADGRKAGDLFSSSLAPSPGVAVRGPFGALRSFSKIDYRRVTNGGPITLELSASVFRSPDGVRKVAALVEAFARSGCQQLQLNAVDVETLRDAKRHPERHRNLIVRVWGWSGYFCELDEVYQDHVIARHGYIV
jgi:pyruvate-formate lyase